MSKLINNYENRIKDFVLKMVENPIIVKKEKDKYMTTRQELYASSSNKILDKKGFVFTSFKSDKERVNDFMRRKEALNKYLTKKLPKNRKTAEFLKKLQEIKFTQPSMHFKARTELEKVYDILRKTNTLNKEQKFLNKQLNKMGFVPQLDEEYEFEGDSTGEVFTNTKNNFNIKKNIDFFSLNENDYQSLSDDEQYKKLLHNKILNERLNMLNKRKFLMNSGAQAQLKKLNHIKGKNTSQDLYQRTHFKAMENLIMFKTSTMNHNLFKKWANDDIVKQKNLNENKKNFFETILLESDYPRTEFNKQDLFSIKKKGRGGSLKMYKTFYNSDNDNENENENSEANSFKGFRKISDEFNNENNNKNNKPHVNRRNSQNFNLFDNKNILQDLEITKEIANSNPLLFNLNFNSLKAQNSHSKCSDEKLSMLKKLAFEYYKNDDLITGGDYKNDAYEDLKKEENIIIDGKEYKKTETDKIADKVLKKCNWNEKKVDYKNMSGRGKLMFTNGLTVKEFEAKYKMLP